MSEINEQNVSDAVGESFTLRTYNNGNIQCTIMDLGSTGPYQVCSMLTEAADKLVGAGLVSDPNDCIRLSWNTQEKDKNGADIWKPYPSIWVNQPSRQQKAVGENRERVDALESRLAQAVATIEAMQTANLSPEELKAREELAKAEAKVQALQAQAPRATEEAKTVSPPEDAAPF